MKMYEIIQQLLMERFKIEILSVQIRLEQKISEKQMLLNENHNKIKNLDM